VLVYQVFAVCGRGQWSGAGFLLKHPARRAGRALQRHGGARGRQCAAGGRGHQPQHHPTTAAGAFDSGLREAARLARLHGRSRDAGVAALLARRAARLGCGGGGAQ